MSANTPSVSPQAARHPPLKGVGKGGTLGAPFEGDLIIADCV